MAKLGSSSMLQFLIIFVLGITSSGFLLSTFFVVNPTTDQTPAWKNTSGGCIAKLADVMFVLDSSSSVGSSNFIKMKLFVKQIIKFFNVDFNLTRIGVMTFSNEPKIWFGLEAYGTEKEIFQAIDNITYLEGGTYTEHALETLRLEGFAHERAGDMAPNIAIVITDGFSHYPEATQIQAEGLRRHGVTLFAIGIGNSTDKTELEGIASTDDVGHKLAYHVDTFDGLRSLESVVAYATCDVKLNETWLINTTMETVTMTDATVGCRDLIPNCDGYGRDICSDYEPWARKNCPYFCRFCAGVTYTVPPCQDKVKCSEYGTYVCTKLSMFLWAKENCPVYCGMCRNTTMPPAAFTTTPTTTPRPIGCHDASICTDGSCNSVEYAKDNCQKTCGYCHVSTTESFSMHSYEKNMTFQVRQYWPKGSCCVGWDIIPAAHALHLTCKADKSASGKTSSCPKWNLPPDCTLERVDHNYCPLPKCPYPVQYAINRITT